MVNKIKKNLGLYVKPASSLLNRSPLDLLAQKMVKEIQLLEVKDKRKKNYKILKN
jgi:hypothetical protein|tara:strand:- start:849 stop:1013 length:165 start_codon:yes stop_codon:yes gene_type:complete